MATDWSLTHGVAETEESPTKTMLTDLDVSAKHRSLNMVLPVRSVGEFLLADESEVDRTYKFSDIASHSTSSSSNHAALLKAQRILAEERILAAEAQAELRRAKLDAARIAVAQAAHQTSSMGSERSRTRIGEVSSRGNALVERPVESSDVDLSIAGLKHTGEIRVHVVCSSRVVSPAKQKAGPDMCLEFDRYSVRIATAFDINMLNEHAENRLKIAEMTLAEKEKQKRFVLDDQAHFRHHMFMHGQSEQAMAQMHLASEQTAFLILQAVARHAELIEEEREMLRVQEIIRHETALREQPRPQKLVEQHIMAVAQTEHDRLQVFEAVAEVRDKMLLYKQLAEARANEEALKAHWSKVMEEQLEANRARERETYALKQKKTQLLAALRTLKSTPIQTPRDPEFFDMTASDKMCPAVPMFVFGGRVGSNTTTVVNSTTATAGGNPRRNAAPPRKPPSPRPLSGPSGSFGAGGKGGGDDGERGPPKDSKPDARRNDKNKQRKFKTSPPSPPGGDGISSLSSSPKESSEELKSASDSAGIKKILKVLSKKGQPKIKEAETVKLSTIPDQPVKYKTWWSETRSTVAAASRRGDEELQLLMKVVREGMSFDELARCRDSMNTLDSKLLAAAIKAAHGELARELALQRFKAAEEAGAMYDLCDLMKVKVTGSKGNMIELSPSIQNREAVIAGTKQVPNVEVLETLFREQAKLYTQLDHDLALYHRSAPGKPERSFEFLMTSAKNWVQRQRDESNRKSIQSRLSTVEGYTVNAMPSLSDSKSEGQNRDSSRESRGQGRRNSPNPDGKGKQKGRSMPRGKSPEENGNGKGRGQSQSPSKGWCEGKNKNNNNNKNNVCRFFLKGMCDRGDQCWYKHEGKPDVPAVPAQAQNNGNAKANADGDPHGEPVNKGNGGKRRRSKKRTGNPAVILTAMVASALFSTGPTVTAGFVLPKDHVDIIFKACSCLSNSALSMKSRNYSVAFHEHVDVTTYDVEDDMYELTPDERDHSYKHGEWFHNTPPEVAEKQALKRAKKWAKYVNKPLNDPTEGQPTDAIALTARAVEDSHPKYLTPNEWLSDTGTPLDLIGKSFVDARLSCFREEIDNPLRFQTANSITTACEKVEMQIAPLGENICPVILDSCPPALTVGQRCMEKGWGFYWPPFAAPVFVKPDGTVIKHVVHNNCPYIVDPTMQNCAMPSITRNVPARPAETTNADRKVEPVDAEIPADIEQQVDKLEQQLQVKDPNESLSKTEQLKLEAHSLEHLLTHMPKNPFCASCQRAKMQSKAAPNRTKNPSGSNPPEKKFGSQVTADYFIASDEIDRSVEGHKVGCVIHCRGSGWTDLYAQKDKSANEAETAFIDFEGPYKSVDSFYSDDAPELKAAARNRGWVHNLSTPGRPDTNGCAERAVRTVLEGIRVTLEHAGLTPKWWSFAGKHFCFSHNISTKNGNCPYDIRHPNHPFQGMKLPFGCLVDFKPSPVKGKVESKFAPKSMPGLFIGWALQPGGRFKGDYFVISLDDVREALKKPLNARIHVQRVKELYRDESEGFIFPMKEHYNKTRRRINIDDCKIDLDANLREQREETLSDRVADEPVKTRKVEEVLAEIHEEDPGYDEEVAPGVPRYQEGGSTSSTAKPATAKEPSSDFDLLGENPLAGGRNPRKYKGTTRPPYVWPEVWQLMSKKKRDEEIAKYKARLEAAQVAMPVEFELPDKAPISQEHLKEIFDRLLGFWKHDTPEYPRAKAGTNKKHRIKNPIHDFPFSALIARPVNKKEIAEQPKAQAALDVEWSKLVNAKVWDEDHPSEWSDISAKAKRAGKTVHIGRVFEICVEKGSELPEGDPGRKYKGRAVFQGNNVRDQNFDWAIFQELGSNPASLTASKIADSYGLSSGNTVQQADAEQAYINAKLNTTETWVRLPPNRVPARWKHLRDPVFRLVLALYGHPESGGHWEQFAHKMLLGEGWQPISPDAMRSIYYHDQFLCVLVLYVDDFRIAGPKANMKAAWQSIRKHIKTGDPEDSGKFLGCMHRLQRKTIPAGGDPWRNYSQQELQSHKGNSVTLNIMEYDMEEFLHSCVHKYCELTKTSINQLDKAETPFIDESKADKEWLTAQYAAEDNPNRHDANVKAKASALLEEGELKPIAARVLMKVFYAARLARWDMLRAIGFLATRITKWDKWDDKRLHRLMSYVHHTSKMRMRSWKAENDSSKALSVDLFVDADFAGDQKDSKSTNGGYMCIRGPNSHTQVSAVSKKQSCVSHSTPEAELVAADHGIRTDALPSLDLLEKIMQKKCQINLHEDNETAAHAIRAGKSPAMRYLHRTHRVSLSWLHDLEQNGTIKTLNCDTELQKADVFTKPFTDPARWKTRCVEIGIWYPGVESLTYQAVEKPKSQKKVTPQPQVEIPGVATAMPNCQDQQYNRTIIEFCCGENSKLGQTGLIAESKGCRVVRVTEKHDVTSTHGINFVEQHINDCHGPSTMLFAAIPCTGGSAWNNINVLKPGGAARLRKHYAIFKKIWATFASCARKLAAKGGMICMEWPRSCRYWSWPCVTNLIQELQLEVVDFDGCRLDLRSVVDDNLIMKPWKFASNCKSIISEFQCLKCDKSHVHSPCAGRDTKLTEGYTFPFVRRVHKAFKKHVCTVVRSTEHQGVINAMPCLLLPMRENASDLNPLVKSHCLNRLGNNSILPSSMASSSMDIPYPTGGTPEKAEAAAALAPELEPERVKDRNFSINSIGFGTRSLVKVNMFLELETTLAVYSRADASIAESVVLPKGGEAAFADCVLSSSQYALMTGLHTNATNRIKDSQTEAVTYLRIEAILNASYVHRWAWFRCNCEYCSSWMVVGIYLSPFCTKHIDPIHDWPATPTTVAYRETDQLAAEAAREMKVIKPQGIQGWTGRDGDSSPAVVHMQALKLKLSCREKGFDSYRNRFLRDADFTDNQEQYQRSESYCETTLRETPAGEKGDRKMNRQFSPQTALAIHRFELREEESRDKEKDKAAQTEPHGRGSDSSRGWIAGTTWTSQGWRAYGHDRESANAVESHADVSISIAIVLIFTIVASFHKQITAHFCLNKYARFGTLSERTVYPRVPTSRLVTAGCTTKWDRPANCALLARGPPREFSPKVGRQNNMNFCRPNFLWVFSLFAAPFDDDGCTTHFAVYNFIASFMKSVRIVSPAIVENATENNHVSNIVVADDRYNHGSTIAFWILAMMIIHSRLWKRHHRRKPCGTAEWHRRLHLHRNRPLLGFQLLPSQSVMSAITNLAPILWTMNKIIFDDRCLRDADFADNQRQYQRSESYCVTVLREFQSGEKGDRRIARQFSPQVALAVHRAEPREEEKRESEKNLPKRRGKDKPSRSDPCGNGSSDSSGSGGWAAVSATWTRKAWQAHHCSTETTDAGESRADDCFVGLLIIISFLSLAILIRKITVDFGAIKRTRLGNHSGEELKRVATYFCNFLVAGFSVHFFVRVTEAIQIAILRDDRPKGHELFSVLAGESRADQFFVSIFVFVFFAIRRVELRKAGKCEAKAKSKCKEKDESSRSVLYGTGGSGGSSSSGGWKAAGGATWASQTWQARGSSSDANDTSESRADVLCVDLLTVFSFVLLASMINVVIHRLNKATQVAIRNSFSTAVSADENRAGVFNSGSSAFVLLTVAIFAFVICFSAFLFMKCGQKQTLHETTDAETQTPFVSSAPHLKLPSFAFTEFGECYHNVDCNAREGSHNLRVGYADLCISRSCGDAAYAQGNLCDLYRFQHKSQEQTLAVRLSPSLFLVSLPCSTSNWNAGGNSSGEIATADATLIDIRSSTLCIGARPCEDMPTLVWLGVSHKMQILFIRIYHFI